MIEAPKKFGDNPSDATEVKKNGTERLGMDQDGVAKKIAAEILLTKENVGLGNVTNPGLANGSTLASDLKLITISGNYIYNAGATNAPTAAAGYAQATITDSNNRLIIATVAGNDGIIHLYHIQMVAGVWTAWSQAYELNYAKLNYVSFNEEITSVPTSVGSMYWDDDAKTVSLVLPDGVIAQIPEELYVNVVRDSEAPNPIVNGTPVYTIGEQGQKPKVGVARADTKAKTLVTGIATHDIANQGRITTFGLIRAVPLSVKPSGETWVAGNYLWLAPTGGMTNVEPSAPIPNVRLGLITNITGSASFDMLVYIRPAMGMYDLYDVNGDAPDNHSVLEWDSVVGYFKKTNEPVFIKVTVGELISAFQKLASHTIPGSDDGILRLQNQQVGKPHSIFEIRSPDTATTEATLSLHNVASGTNDWVFDLSMHNYSGVMKLVSVLSHFTGADAGSWEWWSRYTTGTDYDMIERQLMKLDGQTGYLGIGESLSPEARVHVKQSGWVDKPAMMVVMDSSHENYPEGLYVKNDTNFASGGSLVRFKLVNVTDTATLLKLENAGTGAYINADDKFVVDKDGNITSPTIDAIKGTGYTEGSLKTHEDRLDTLEGTGAGSVADDIAKYAVKLTKMPDGAIPAYAKDFSTVSSVPAEWDSGGGDSTLSLEGGELVATYVKGAGRFDLVFPIGLPADAKTIVVRLRKTGTVSSMYMYLDGPNKNVTPNFGIKEISDTYIFDISAFPSIGISRVRFYFYGTFSVGDTIRLSSIYVGDYSYLANSLSTESSRIANQLGDTAGVGKKASGTITSNGTNVSDGDTVTIAGKVYTFKTILGTTEGNVLIGGTAAESLDNLKLAVNSTGVTAEQYCATFHPLVEATTNTDTVQTLSARASGILGNSITLAKSASTLTISGSTLTGGTDDVGEKMRTQIASLNGQWITPTLVNGWVSFTNSTAQYKKLANGMVAMRGKVMNGSVSTAIFVLPVGFRPSRDCSFVIPSRTNASVFCRADIGVTGNVIIHFSSRSEEHTSELQSH